MFTDKMGFNFIFKETQMDIENTMMETMEIISETVLIVNIWTQENAINPNPTASSTVFYSSEQLFRTWFRQPLQPQWEQ